MLTKAEIQYILYTLREFTPHSESRTESMKILDTELKKHRAKHTCDSCGGTGRSGNRGDSNCTMCYGRGWV